MAKEFLIGVDIGTQGTKAVLFRADGKCLSLAFRKSKLYQPSNRIVEEDPNRQLATVYQTIKDCVTNTKIDPSSVAAIGIDGQMAGVIGIDSDGNNVTPYDSWLDTRCAPYIKKMEKTAGQQILCKTGNAPSFNHGPKKLWWMHEHKKTYKQIKAFVQPGGYVAMRLCGLNAADAFIDRTYLHFSGFANNRKKCWDADLCRTFKLDPQKLPKIVEPHKIIGQLTAGMAKRCGLKTSTAVVAGCGDTAASFLACGATKEGVCVDVAGTASVFAANTKTFKADEKNRTLGCGQAAVVGLWHPYAYINGGGMNLEWFRKNIASSGQKASSDMTFDKLQNLAQKLNDDENTPIFIPHLAGRVCPSQPDLRGAWVDLTWEHTIGHMYKAVLEGVALEYGIYKNVLKQMYPKLKLKEIRITGGGEKSRLWNKIKSAVLQVPVVQILQSQGAPMGSAMLAGYGVGLFKSLPKTADRWVKKGNKHLADKKQQQFYKPRIKRYKKILDCLG